MKNEVNQFSFDKERNVTVSLASLLDKNGWEVVACHPPGGHTSFSMLDGRRSKGGYMPDVVAIKFDHDIDDYIVAIAESKPTFQKSNEDITKLINLNSSHASWIAFRLQNHIDSKKWSENYDKKLQKIVAYEEGNYILGALPSDMIALKLSKNRIIERFVGNEAPARKLFVDKAFTDK